MTQKNQSPRKTRATSNALSRKVWAGNLFPRSTLAFMERARCPEGTSRQRHLTLVASKKSAAVLLCDQSYADSLSINEVLLITFYKGNNKNNN